MKNAFITVLIVTVLLGAAAVGLLALDNAQVNGKRSKAMADAQATYSEQKAAYDQEIADIEAQDRADQAAYDEAVRKYNEQLKENGGVSMGWPSPATGQGWEIVDLTDYGLDQTATVTMDKQELVYNGLLLVNQWHSRPTWFNDSAPVNLHNHNKELRLDNHNITLLESAADAWGTMLADVSLKYGWDYFMIYRGYRTYEEQEKLFNEQKQKLSGSYTDEGELLAATARRVNLPGTSEYNTGLSAWPRLYKNGDAAINAKDKDFFASEEGIWMVEHSWEYGFVFRFPLADYPVRGTQDKSYKTGVSTKLRLFRYVGRGNAAAMHIMDLCLEEYLEFLQDHWHIAIYQDGTLKYEIFLQNLPETITSGTLDDVENVSFLQSTKPSIVNQEFMYDNLGHIITVIEY